MNKKGGLGCGTAGSHALADGVGPILISRGWPGLASGPGPLEEERRRKK
jgi:hypothetical protein